MKKMNFPTQQMKKGAKEEKGQDVLRVKSQLKTN
jgi:hypothetical protein